MPRRDEVVGFGKEFAEQFQADDASGLAAELAYRWLFALFPFGIFLAALGAFVASWIGIENPAQQMIDGLGDNLPAGLASSIQPELERVIGQQQPGIASIGALAALWAATSGTMTVIKAMNRAYGVEETRGTIRKYAIGIGLTIAGAVGLLVSFVTIVGGALLTEQVASQLGVGPTAWTVINVARWPIVFALLVVAVAVMLRIGPNMTPTWRWSVVGGSVFALGWLIATFVLGLYVANVADYGATYGTLAGVIVMMLWLYVTALILVGAGELVALLTKRTEPERLAERRETIAVARGMGRAAAVIRSTVDDARQVVTPDTSPVPPLRPRESQSVRARRSRPRFTRPVQRAEGEVPGRVVAVAAGLVAIAVAFLTRRLPER